MTTNTKTKASKIGKAVLYVLYSAMCAVPVVAFINYLVTTP